MLSLLGLKAKALIASGLIVWSVGLYWTGKYVAYKELSQGVASKYIDKADKQAANDVRAADSSLRRVNALENENKELRRQLGEVTIDRDSSCDLTVDELRILNSIVEGTKR